MTHTSAYKNNAHKLVDNQAKIHLDIDIINAHFIQSKSPSKFALSSLIAISHIGMASELLKCGRLN